MMAWLNKAEPILITYPVASGKTTAMIIAMLTNVCKNLHTSNGGLQALFITGNEHEAVEAHLLAQQLSELTSIKMACATRNCQDEIDSINIIIGTMSEVIKKIDERDIHGIEYIYIDSAEKILSYSQLWEFLHKCQNQPIVVAAGLKVNKPVIDKMKAVLDAKHMFLPNILFIGKNVQVLNILSTKYQHKMNSLKTIIAGIGVSQLLITVKVSNIIFRK